MGCHACSHISLTFPNAEAFVACRSPSGRRSHANIQVAKNDWKGFAWQHLSFSNSSARSRVIAARLIRR